MVQRETVSLEECTLVPSLACSPGGIALQGPQPLRVLGAGLHCLSQPRQAPPRGENTGSSPRGLSPALQTCPLSFQTYRGQWLPAITFSVLTQCPPIDFPRLL